MPLRSFLTQLHAANFMASASCGDDAEQGRSPLSASPFSVYIVDKVERLSISDVWTVLVSGTGASRLRLELPEPPG